MAKKPSRSCTPLGVSSSRRKMVARISPVTMIVPSRIPNSSGMRRVLVKARLISTHTSTGIGFAYVGICSDTVPVPLPATSFPRATLSAIAYSSVIGLTLLALVPSIAL